MEHINIEALTRFFYYKFDEDYAFSGHSHTAWEINIVLSGRMSVTFGGSVTELSAGDLLVGEPMWFHCNRAIGKNAEMAVIHFEVCDAPTGNPKGYSVRSLSQDEFSIARVMLNELLRRRYDKDGVPLEKSEDGEYTNAKKLCEVLTSRVLGAAKPELESSSPRVRLYREAVELMDKRVEEKLSIEEISRHLHISPALLKKIFKEFTGGGVMTFFTEMKIRTARKMLERGMSISLVSDRLGFSSQCYFSSCFSRIVGMGPKKYQKNHPCGK